MKPNLTTHLLMIWLLLMGMLLPAAVDAQVSNYQFSQSVGVYTPITGGVVLGNSANNNQRFTDPDTPSGSTLDTGPGFPIGFDFSYNGVSFNRIGVHTKGWVSLGDAAEGVNMAATNIAAPLSSSAFISPSYLRSRIAAVGINLQGQTGSELRIETIGVAPNRICVVQWSNYRVGLQTSMNLNFQLRLHETTNLIQVVFGGMTFNATTNQADVGLGGFWANDVNNRRTISPHNWNNTLPGINNASKCTFNTSTTPPVNGRTFTWTPAGCQLPYLFQIANFTSTTADVVWLCANCTGNFIVEYGPPDFEPGTGALAGTGGTVVTASGSSATITGLAPFTYYDVYVRQDCGGSLFSLNSGPLSFITRPPNDEVCNALPLTVGVNGGYTNQFASAQPNEPAPPPLGCNVQNGWCLSNEVENSLWFTFTPTLSGIYSINAYGFDVQAALYSANTCSAILTPNALLLAANDNGSPTQTGGALLTNLCLAAGITYYLQTDGYQAAEGIVTIEVSYLGAAPPATITCPPNTTVSAGFTACEAFVAIPLPTVNGICGSYAYTNNYTQTPNASSIYPVGTTTVIYTLADVENTANCSFTVTVTNPLPVSVTCQNTTVALNASGFASITPASVFAAADACSLPVLPVSVFPNAFTCAQVGSNTVTLTVADAAGATATCQSTVQVADNTPPAAQCQNTTITLNAQGTATLLPNAVNNNSTDNCVITQQIVLPNAFTCAQIGQNTVTLTLTDAAGNTASCQATVTITDQTAPTAQCQNIALQLNAQGQATITPSMVNNNSADNCSITNLAVLPNVFTCIDIGIATTTLTVTDAAGNTATCQSSITITDALPPIALCQNATLALNASGMATVLPELINNNSSDNCFLSQLSVFPNVLTCSHLPATTVTLTATDQSGNTATCAAQITLTDPILPNAQCQNATISLTQNGTASLLPDVVNNNSTDNCSIANLAVTPNTFTCSNLGQNTVTLTVTDSSGNTATCQSSITITDNLPPQVQCQNTAVTLDLSGNAAITAAQINNNSSDNCAITNLNIFPNTFTCVNIGENTVTLTATDQSGNTAACQALVTVIFDAPAENLCQNITIQLNSDGNAAITPAQVFSINADNCGGLNPQSVSPANFTCVNLGQNTVTLTLANAQGNAGTCTATVTVQDALPPTAQCQNTTVQLNAQGQATITASMVNNNSADNCSITQQSVLPNLFTCANIGDNTVTLTLTDSSGNTAACTAVVTVADIIPPVAQCVAGFSTNIDQTGIINLLPDDLNNGSTDNCSITNFTVSPLALTCANIGTNTVTLTAIDQSGNTATCATTITVIFSAQNAQLCQNITVNLAPQATTFITPADVFLGGGEECGGFSPLSVLPNSFTCANLGANSVTLTVADIGGATSSCTATVTITDNTPPTAQCQNTAVLLGQNGTATLLPNQINNNSTDNCTVTNLSITPDIVNCSHLGAATVTLTATDQSGNTATCTATVTVTDNLAPTVSCVNATLEITTQSSVLLLPEIVTGSLADNCGINATNVLPNTFTCANVGNNTVTLTVTDTSGNTATCSAVVNVAFNPPPVSVCQPTSVSLNSNGLASVSPMSIFTGGNDACSLLSSVSVSPSAFTCANLGSNTVTLTVSNTIGYTSTCQTTITVTDNLPPAAQCQNAVVSLNNLGEAVLTTGLVNNNSTDNCSIGSISVFPAVFTCANLGSNTVTLTAIDLSGNSSTCTATVTVADTTPPQVTCANITVDITATGSASITPASVTASATDNCQVTSFALNINTFTCANVGSNTITLTATDQSGNTATCLATVNVVFNPPPITNICQNYAVNLNQNGTASIIPSNVFGGGADLCGGITPVLVSPNSFTCANVGNNTVTLTMVNSVGNTTTCSATVSVSDQIPPQITCPNNINATTQLGICGANLTINPPNAADNCSVTALVNTATGSANASGFYLVGATNVQYTAADAAGNTATCFFTINITDTEPPTINCPPNMVKPAANCFEPFFWTEPTAADNCGVLSIVPNSPSGSLFGIGATTVTYTATDLSGNTQTCSFTVTLNDVTPPTFVCPSGMNLSTQGQTCLATANWTIPTPTDNCTGATLTGASHTPGTLFSPGVVTVSYAAADGWGNTSSCSFTLTIADTTPPFIDCPNNKTLPATPNACQAYVPVDDFFASDNCGSLTVTNNINGTNDASGIYPLGTTTVTYTASDNVGNTAICTFNITIFDGQAPVVNCPAAVTQPLSGNNCFAIVSVPLATATDNCPGIVTLTNSLTGSANASGAYLVGTTTVTYTATDLAGNTATCNFTVSVLEQTPPTIAACPPNITVPVVPGACSATASWNTPVATDNCSVVTLSVSSASGGSFNTGVNTITYTATDASGNTSTCSFTVTVLDPNPPAITCPPNMVSCSTFPFWPIATATDDCLLTGVLANKPQGAYMAPGINTVTFTATDASGNTATCTFSINVAPPLSVILSPSTFGGNNITCNGAATGIINGVAFGGVAPYSYQWSNGATTNILSGLPAGSYTTTVTDALGCSGSNSITLTQPPPIICSATTLPASCAGIANGSATVSVLGTGTYNYAWSGPSGTFTNTATITNLLPGVYTATVTNPLGCTCTTTATVSSGTATTTLTGNMTTTPAAPPIIFNSSAITFTGGSAPYTFTWVTAGYVQYSSSNTGITVIYSNTAFWSVTVSDNNPCTIGELVFSNAPNVNTQLLTIVNATITSDSGGSNGSISLTVVGGNACPGAPPYHYSWSGPSNWFAPTNTNTPNLSGLPSGWYIVTVRDCGPDGIPNTGDEQVAFGYYWVTKKTRGRGKLPDTQLQVYPNPAHREITLDITLPQPEPFEVVLYDITGRKVTNLYQQTDLSDFNTQTVVFTQLPLFVSSGLYIIRVEMASGYELQQKLVVW